MNDRDQEHRQILKAAREFRRDLQALQKELGLQTEEELRRYLTRSHPSTIEASPKRV